MNPASLILILGVAHANPQDPGIWYLSDESHVLHQNSITYGLGWVTPAYEFGIQNLGRTETDSDVVPFHFKTVGKEWGAYGLRTVGTTWKAGLGVWVYKASVDHTHEGFQYSSSAWGIAPMAKFSYDCIALTVRGAESRAIDWNGNHQPSPTKGFVTTVQFSFDVK